MRRTQRASSASLSHARRRRRAASNGVGRGCELAVDERRGEVGPADQAAGREPGPAAGPAADVRRIEQVLPKPRRPVGQQQRARRRVEQSPGPGPRRRRTRPGRARALPRLRVGEERLARRTVSTAQPTSRSCSRSPSASVVDRGLGSTAPSPKNSSQSRHASRRDVAGCSSSSRTRSSPVQVPGLAEDRLLAAS